MIAIVDYGVGNLFSLESSFKYIGKEAIRVDAYKIDQNPQNAGYRSWEQTQINNSGAEKFVICTICDITISLIIFFTYVISIDFKKWERKFEIEELIKIIESVKKQEYLPKFSKEEIVDGLGNIALVNATLSAHIELIPSFWILHPVYILPDFVNNAAPT